MNICILTCFLSNLEMSACDTGCADMEGMDKKFLEAEKVALLKLIV